MCQFDWLWKQSDSLNGIFDLNISEIDNSCVTNLPMHVSELWHIKQFYD